MKQIFALIHKYGCGGRAFLADHQPCFDESLITKGFYHTDGSPMITNERAFCDTCGELLMRKDLIAEWFEPIVAEAPVEELCNTPAVVAP